MPPAIMAHSYAQNHIHLVFSTKNREKLFTRKFLPCLWAYTAAICKNHDLLTFAVGVMFGRDGKEFFLAGRIRCVFREFWLMLSSGAL